jgi:hypothetical protein
MSDSQKLFLVRTVHTVIYLVMASSVLLVLYSGIAGYDGMLLFVALGLVGLESVVFIGNGMRCPLTALAKKYGAEKGYAFDTFLPESFTRHTFRFFATLLVIGLVLLALRNIPGL